jgi:PilZ domain
MNASRQSPRKVIDRVLSIQMEPDIQAIVQNISDEGLCFHALTPVTQSGTIRFSFAENGRRTEAIGELVWIDPTKKTGGLRFTSMSLATRERIRNWLDQAAAVPSMGAASEPAPPRNKISPPSDVHSPQPDAAPPRYVPPSAYVPPPGTPLIQPTMPGFALLEGESQPVPYTWEQEMARQESGPKFFRGFVTGALGTAILAGILFYVYGDPAALLAQLRAMTGATAATRTTTDTLPSTATVPPAPAAIPPASAAQGLPPSSSIGTPATPVPLPEAAGNPQANSTANPARTEPLPAESHSANALPSTPPKVADAGDAEFALAERYLREKSGPGSSAAAANSLWAAVKKGNVSAEIALADLYARGDGVTKNCDQARVLLRAAAEKGSTIASQQLAQVVRSGCR